SLTETNLNTSTVTVDLTAGTYNGSLAAGNFSLATAPTGTTIASVIRNSATSATLTLTFDGTDFDANTTLSVTVLQAALLTGTGPATTGTVAVTAVLEAGAVIALTSPVSLTETNLNTSTVTVDLTAGTYNGSLAAGNFSLATAPTGTTIASVIRNSATSATLTLTFDGTDFDANTTLSVTVLQAALLTGTGPATTGTVAVTAVLEAGAVIALTSPVSLTETNLNTSTVTVDLTAGTYNGSLAAGNFSLATAPTGTTIASVIRNSATSATLTLTFDGTDFDANTTLSVTVLQAALLTGTGPATTGTVAVTAVLEAGAVIALTSPVSLTETNLNTATVTVDLTAGTYNGSLAAGNFSLATAPTGTTIASVVRNSATSATLTLAFDGTDFDANTTLSVTVLQAALLTGTGPATTGTVAVTAVLEAGAVIASTNPASLSEANLNGATVTVDLTAGTYNGSLATGNFSLATAPTGTTTASVVRNSATSATLTLAFDGTDFDASTTLSVTVLQAALLTGTGPATTGTVAVTAVLEAGAVIALTSPASLTETNLNTATVTVDLTAGTYNGSLAAGN